MARSDVLIGAPSFPAQPGATVFSVPMAAQARLLMASAHPTVAPSSARATASIVPPPDPIPGPAIDGRLFSAASAFNKPIPADFPLHADSAAMTGADWVKGYDANTILRPWLGLFKQFGNIVHVPAGTPNISVKMDNPTCNVLQIQVPIPPGTTAPRPDPENTVIFLTEDGKTFEVYQLTAPGVTPYRACPADSSWHIGSYAIPSWSPGTSDWTGLGYGLDSVRASEISVAAGMVRPASLTSPYPDNFGHAIAIATWRTVAAGQSHPRFVQPAAAGDGIFTGIGGIPMGARLQLDPAYDIDSDPWVLDHGTWAKAYLKTLQVYGAIIVDSGAQVYWQEYNLPGGVDPYGGVYPWATAAEYNIGCFTAGCDQSASIAVPNAVMTHFRVLDWTQNPNGNFT